MAVPVEHMLQASSPSTCPQQDGQLASATLFLAERHAMKQALGLAEAQFDTITKKQPAAVPHVDACASEIACRRCVGTAAQYPVAISSTKHHQPQAVDYSGAAGRLSPRGATRGKRIMALLTCGSCKVHEPCTVRVRGIMKRPSDDCSSIASIAGSEGSEDGSGLNTKAKGARHIRFSINGSPLGDDQGDDDVHDRGSSVSAPGGASQQQQQPWGRLQAQPQEQPLWGQLHRLEQEQQQYHHQQQQEELVAVGTRSQRRVWQLLGGWWQRNFAMHNMPYW